MPRAVDAVLRPPGSVAASAISAGAAKGVRENSYNPDDIAANTAEFLLPTERSGVRSPGSLRNIDGRSGSDLGGHREHRRHRKKERELRDLTVYVAAGSGQGSEIIATSPLHDERVNPSSPSIPHLSPAMSYTMEAQGVVRPTGTQWERQCLQLEEELQRERAEWRQQARAFEDQIRVATS